MSERGREGEGAFSISRSGILKLLPCSETNSISFTAAAAGSGGGDGGIICAEWIFSPGRIVKHSPSLSPYLSLASKFSIAHVKGGNAVVVVWRLLAERASDVSLIALKATYA